eukprot:CAMPEP_0185198850 /NCGR_PEP_ID=MMETSP1140-20130426/43795_1 /TAXON_ID=298111 /ORGANISM="Pavlova sp., Strain CCMP459" /LENGTH=39 /DNA_ID= /DNA_START= /DNA_END= /DNA_ORIENTATION=
MTASERYGVVHASLSLVDLARETGGVCGAPAGTGAARQG